MKLRQNRNFVSYSEGYDGLYCHMKKVYEEFSRNI